jgi:hypothetical protein
MVVARFTFFGCAAIYCVVGAFAFDDHPANWWYISGLVNGALMDRWLRKGARNV